MITKGQSTIVKEICKIQLESLDNVLTTVELEEENQFLLDALGSNRAEFDEELLRIRLRFVELKENPDRLYTLGYEELMVILYILKRLREFNPEVADTLPKATRNLSNKIEVLTGASEFMN